jgi:hypothetical protein
MISDNKPVDWDVVSLPIGQLVEVLFAWRREDEVSPTNPDEGFWGW